jgi:PAS domain S-box-containing protein
MKSKKPSLFTILALNIFFIVSIVMFTNLYFLYHGIKKDMKKDIETRVNIEAKTLTKNLSTFIESYAINEYEKLIGNNLKHKKFLAIIVKDFNMGKVISEEYYLTGKIKCKSGVVEYDPRSTKQKEILSSSYYYRSFKIASSDNQQIGTLEIYISDEEIVAKLQNIFLDIVLKSIIISIILIISLLFLSIYFSLLKPINNIIDSLSQTNRDGIPINLLDTKGSKEISYLSNTINKTIEAIKKSNITLKDNIEELTLAKLKYKTILHLASDGIFIMDRDGNLLEYSKKTKNLLGYSSKELENFTIYDWDKDITKEELSHLINELSNDPIIIDRIHTKKDGTTYHAQIAATKIIVEDDFYIYASVRDITQDIALKKTIIDEKNFISTMINSANAIIAVIEPDGTMTRLNRYGEEFTGYSQQEVSSSPYFWKRFLNKSIQDEVLNIISEANKGNLIEYFQNTWYSKDGTERVFEWSNTLVYKDDGSLDYIFTIGIDITDKIEAQKQLLEQNQKLKDSEERVKLVNENLENLVKEKVNEIREKEQLLIQQSKLATMGEMIGNIAHQWRQPLNIISIKKDLIVEEYFDKRLDDKVVEEFEEDMNNIVQYMSKTIDDFRNFFIPSKDKIVFNIVQTLESITNIVDAQLQNHNIDLIINNHHENSINLKGYPNEFKQVLINLISNAKDAILKRQMKNEIETGKIVIDLYKNKNSNQVKVIVTDNGGGIPKDILPKIFEPYFTTKFQSQGTGLGLYMSKTIIEINMQGTLRVENIEDGARFTVSLLSYVD